MYFTLLAPHHLHMNRGELYREGVLGWVSDVCKAKQSSVQSTPPRAWHTVSKQGLVAGKRNGHNPESAQHRVSERKLDNKPAQPAEPCQPERGQINVHTKHASSPSFGGERYRRRERRRDKYRSCLLCGVQCPPATVRHRRNISKAAI